MADIEKLNPSELVSAELLGDLRKIIDSARSHVAATANYELTMMYWNIGTRINSDVLNNERAEYGQQIVSTLSTQLTELYGKDFSTRNLHRMIQFSQLFPNEEIVSTLATKLFWSHFMEVLPLKDDVAREFYITMAANERWSIKQLREKIDGMLYERTAIATKPEELIKQELADLRDNETLSPDLVFKSPYFLEFTGLRQKRMIIDGEDFYLDLLFYHRKLHRLIAIDLKLGRFKAQYKGQMELYLRWLEQNEMQPGEESPLGLLLCTEGSEEQINLLQLDKSGIRVAQYLTELPSKEVLLRQLQKSLAAAKEIMPLTQSGK